MSKTMTIKEVKNRDEQFQQITKTVAEFKQKGLPILSIDSNKRPKNLSDNFIVTANLMAKKKEQFMTTLGRVWQTA